jgi:ParB family chromosome partitioning protein
MTQEQVAQRVGKSRSAVANFLRIKGLPPEIRDSLSVGQLSMGHAKALMGVEGTARQLEIWQKILARGLSVRETEQLAAARKLPPTLPSPDQPSSEEIYFSDVSERLSRRLGTRVQIKRRGKKGRLEIEFYSDNDLERLLEMLQGSGTSMDAY